MPCFLGIDGGCTNTACLVVDENGQKLAQLSGTGTSHRQHGGEAVLKTLRQLARQCAQQAGISLEQLGGVCVGLPAYGENATMDAMMREGIHAIFPHVLIVNDVQVGWAGSLACMPGILWWRVPAPSPLAATRKGIRPAAGAGASISATRAAATGWQSWACSCSQSRRTGGYPGGHVYQSTGSLRAGRRL